jgi:hypothetical protein
MMMAMRRAKRHCKQLAGLTSSPWIYGARSRLEPDRMFVRFNSPVAQQKRLKQSWLWVAVLYGASIYFAYSWFHRDWTPHTWVMPAQDRLLTASGAFSAAHLNTRAPYFFTTDAGSLITLGCNPEEYGTNCFSDYGFSLPALAARHVTIGYFYVHNPNRENQSNVIATISDIGGPILSYAESEARIEKWALLEEKTKRSWLNIALDSFLPMFFATCATAIAITKLTYRNDQETQNV